MEGLILSVLFISFAMKRLSDNKVDPVETTKPVVQTSNNNITITPTADPMREVKKRAGSEAARGIKGSKTISSRL